MDILTAIKIRNLDGTYSDPIPISALAENIIYDDKNTLIDALGTIETNEQGKVLSLQSQILEIKQNGINATNAQQDQVPIADGQTNWAWGNLDYTKLINKPRIEGIILGGNKTFPELNLNSITNSEIENIFSF